MVKETPKPRESWATALRTIVAMVAFAANSILCRMALGGGGIDATSFTSARILSGAITLAILLQLSRSSRQVPWFSGSWLSPTLLAAYAVTFSFAYVSLSTGTGALIMFGAVQITMILRALLAGERPGKLEWTGLILAFGGLVYLVSPGIEAPPLHGALLMALSGISWGLYTIRGRGGVNPLASTAGNFILATPLVLMISALSFSSIEITTSGLLLAILSGSLASGCGYVVWYAALRHLTSTRAAIVQLSVPLIAATGGIVFISETVTLRLILAGGLILGGIGMAVGGRPKPRLQSTD